MKKGACISPCTKYRYWLYREWDNQKRSCLFIMLNPSTADDKKDDPTIRRCIAYAQGFGYGSLYVVNLFALRATNKAEIQKTENPIGPENDQWIEQLSKKADCIIAAWGNDGKYLNRSQEILKKLSQEGHIVYCLKVSKHNEPCHPLYLKKESVLIPLLE